MSTKEQLEKDIAILESQLADKKAKLTLITVKLWKPKDNELYFTIDEFGCIADYRWVGEELDNRALLLGNVFPTQELATKELNKRLATGRVLTKLRELEGDFIVNWSDENQKKYHIEYTHDDKSFYVDYYYQHQVMTNAYYSTESVCQWVIDNMKDDLKLMFDVE